MALEGYPPPHHVLSDLGIEVDAPDGSVTVARLPVTPHLFGGHGGVRLGVLATLVDVVGGAIGVEVLAPDWMATSDLAIHGLRPATGAVVEARGTVVRRGRTTLVIETTVSDGADAPGPVAWATMTFAVLPASAAAGPRPRRTERRAFRGAGFDRPVSEAVGITTGEGVAPGDGGAVASLPVDDYVRNSFGAVQGGVVALLGETAAMRSLYLAGAAPELAPVDLQVTYVATARAGPVLATPRWSEVGARGASTVVELVDPGAGGRLTSVVSLRAERW